MLRQWGHGGVPKTSTAESRTTRGRSRRGPRWPAEHQVERACAHGMVDIHVVRVCESRRIGISIGGVLVNVES